MKLTLLGSYEELSWGTNTGHVNCTDCKDFGCDPIQKTSSHIYLCYMTLSQGRYKQIVIEKCQFNDIDIKSYCTNISFNST